MPTSKRVPFPGINWNSQDYPEDLYEYQVHEPGSEGEWLPILDQREPACSVLTWLANYYIWKTPGRDVIANEQLTHRVLKESITRTPAWSAEIQLFDFEEQQVLIYRFRLKPT